jgi:hypothetical protein
MKVSEHFGICSTIRDEFAAGEVAKALMREYDLPEDEMLETNLNRFMRHTGMCGRHLIA